MDDSERKNWLRQQWERVRNLTRRDVIIAQVEQGAENVAVGKNIFQLNVGGRNITPYVLVTMLAALLVAAFIVVPRLEYLWNPSQMPGAFNIAVAQFGEMDAGGSVSRSADGAFLSRQVYDALTSEYAANRAQIGATQVAIWYDDAAIAAKNVRFGTMRGSSAREREAAAIALAKRVNAHMVIYGHIEQNDPTDLQLEFYVSPFLGSESSSIVGRHSLGRPIALAGMIDGGANPLANLDRAPQLSTRVSALFWLTVAFMYDLVGDNEAALALLQDFDQLAPKWQDEDGRELLYFFRARQELFLDRAQEAQISVTQALHINPEYDRAYIVQGSIHLFASLEQKMAAHTLKATDEAAAQIALDLAAEAVQAAQSAYTTAVDLAKAADNPLIEMVAQMSLASAYWQEGALHDLAEEYPAAIPLYDQALSTVAPTIAYFDSAGQARYLAQAYVVQGNAQFQRGAAQGRLGDEAAQQADFEAAAVAYGNCIAQQERAPLDDILQEKIINTNCRSPLEAVRIALKEGER